jgi:hypothetical protein
MVNNNESPVSNPTYMGNIRYFFEDIDREHMNPMRSLCWN